ncbi:MAG: hypothetical protein COB01_02445 [Lutibacter sp.]|nr:MAG: hypothetical protein COB01_02445 [Lutibacter sp.]
MDNIILSDKEKLEAIIQLLNPRKRKHYKSEDKQLLQEVTFMVEDKGELRYMISCLLRVCILALGGEGGFCAPRLSNCSQNLTIATLLELADALLPDDQLISYDAIEKLLHAE